MCLLIGAMEKKQGSRFPLPIPARRKCAVPTKNIRSFSGDIPPPAFPRSNPPLHLFIPLPLRSTRSKEGGVRLVGNGSAGSIDRSSRAMKFGKSLSNQIEETVPEWRDEFARYKELKRRLNLIIGDGPSKRSSVADGAGEESFMSFLETELDKL